MGASPGTPPSAHDYCGEPINGSLQHETHRKQFLLALWGQDEAPYVDANYRFYFAFLHTRIGHFHFLSPQPSIKPETYGGLVELVDFVREHAHMSVHDIGVEIGRETNKLRTSDHVTVPPLGKNVSDGDVVAALGLAVSAWSMVSLGDIFPAQAGVTPWPWRTEDSLERTLERYTKWVSRAGHTRAVGAARNDAGNDGRAQGNAALLDNGIDKDNDGDAFHLEFPDYFTLCSMSRLVGFKVHWTYNLLDHLRVRKLRNNGFTTHVFIFHHATVLNRIAAADPKFVPKFIGRPAEEAARTLGLLIPYGDGYPGSWWRPNDDRDHRDWFDSNTDHTIDPRAAGQAVRSWRERDFVYWRTRLLALQAEHNAAGPRGILQWWRDQRVRGAWQMLWITIAAAALAVMALIASTVTGGISAHEAIKASQKDDSNAAGDVGGVLVSMLGNSTASLAGCCLCLGASSFAMDGNISIPTNTVTNSGTLLETALAAATTSTPFPLVTTPSGPPLVYKNTRVSPLSTTLAE